MNFDRQLHASVTVRLTDGALLDYDELLQQRAFADLNGIVGADTITNAPYYRWEYHTPLGLSPRALVCGAAGKFVTFRHILIVDNLFPTRLGELLSSPPTDSVVSIFQTDSPSPRFSARGLFRPERYVCEYNFHFGRGRDNGLDKTWNFNSSPPTKAPTPRTFQTRVDNSYLRLRICDWDVL